MDIVYTGIAGSTQHSFSAVDIARLLKLSPEETEALKTGGFDDLVFPKGQPVSVTVTEVADAILRIPGFEKAETSEAPAVDEVKAGDAPASTPARSGSRGSAVSSEGSASTPSGPNA